MSILVAVIGLGVSSFAMGAIMGMMIAAIMEGYPWLQFFVLALPNGIIASVFAQRLLA